MFLLELSSQPLLHMVYTFCIRVWLALWTFLLISEFPVFLLLSSYLAFGGGSVFL